MAKLVTSVQTANQIKSLVPFGVDVSPVTREDRFDLADWYSATLTGVDLREDCVRVL